MHPTMQTLGEFSLPLSETVNHVRIYDRMYTCKLIFSKQEQGLKIMEHRTNTDANTKTPKESTPPHQI
jgi:hypothetical protein